MAFEIYEGIITGTNITAANQMIDKLIEMWNFDDVSQSEGEYHSATYGNIYLFGSSGNMCIGVSGSTNANFQATLPNANVGSNSFVIVKAQNSIMLAWTSNNQWSSVIIGNIKSVDGDTSKGMLGYNRNYNFVYPAYNDALQNNLSINSLTTNKGTQLVPVMAENGYYLDNGYRILASKTSLTNLSHIYGQYMIGDDKYYVAGGLAIKEE